MADGSLIVTKSEQFSLRVLEDYRAGRISRKEAAAVLGVSERAVNRRARKVREMGVAGVKHGNFRRPPANKKPDGMKDEVIRLVKELYFDFNVSHAREMLQLHHEIPSLSYMTLLSWCRKEGLGKRKRRRPSKARVSRERMANEGLMLQMDGSHHKWNGKDEWCLITLIDDATSDLVFARFFADGETTWNCLAALRSVIEQCGIPGYVYADKAGWAGGSEKRPGFSQFVRACDELGTGVIAAHSPQAKGRVERSFGTTQDRLIPELRLYGIHSIADANRYLEQCFQPQWRERYVVQARSETTHYRPVPAHMTLDEIICLKHLRVVSSDHCVSFANDRYRIKDLRFGSLRGKQVTVHEYQDGSVAHFYGHLRLKTELVVPPKRDWERQSG